MAAKLILSMDGSVLKECTLNKERTTIGRKQHNDIVIDNLAVSGEHAVVLTILNDSFLEDLDSTNGVMVNGVQIKKHFLQNNDVIEIGKYKLKYLNDQQGQGQAAEGDFEKTMVLRGPPRAQQPAAPQAVAPQAVAPQAVAPQAVAPQGKAPSVDMEAKPKAGVAARTSPYEKTGKFEATRPPGEATHPMMPAAAQPKPVPPASPAPAAAAAAQPAGVPPAAVQILSGPNIGKELELVKNLTTLGKPGVQVAVLTRRPHGYFITHVEGASYPVVNGKALDEHPHQLNDHDIIELAGIKMEFYFKE